MLAIEIDGGSHKLKGPEDEMRQRRLEELGVRFLRFTEAAVRSDVEAVVCAIDNWIVKWLTNPGAETITHPGAARHPS